MEFNEVLKDIRNERGLTQKQMSELIYTTPQNIAHYEHKRRVCSVQQAMEILNSLGIDVLIKNGEMEMDFRMCEQYFDKNGNEIKEGMILRHDDGDLDLVYKSDDNDLGFNATNPDYHFNCPQFSIQIYPLSSFSMREWIIVNKEDLTKEELYKLDIFKLDIFDLGINKKKA